MILSPILKINDKDNKYLKVNIIIVSFFTTYHIHQII